MKKNEELIKKTIETSDLLNGGRLNPEQQDKFLVYVKEYSTMLDACRYHVMTENVEEIDKLHLGEPITESAAEATAQGSPNNEGEVKTNKVTLSVKKTRSTYNISTETLQTNIERGGFEDTLIQNMGKRISTDLEMLSIQGDTGLGSGNKFERLLNRLDGWDKQTENAHIVDAAGATMSKDIFRIMKRSLPNMYRKDPGLRWIMPESLVDDWRDWLVEQKVGGVFGDAIEGGFLNPLGIPILSVELIPDDKPVSTGGATPAQALGYNSGPFVIIEGSNDNLDIDITDAADATTNVTLTLDAGTLHPVEVAKQLNEAFSSAGAPARAKDDGEGLLFIETTESGVNTEIIVNTPADDAAPTLGIDGVDEDGSDDGTVLEGSFIWLANPENFIFGVRSASRMYAEFNKDTDVIENVIYNQVDAKIEDINSIVKAKNIKLSSL